MPMASRWMPHCGSSGYFDLGDQIADRRIRAREFYPGCLAHEASAAVAADEIVGTKRAAIAQRNVDAAVILHEARHLAATIDRDAALIDPVGEDALYVFLPERQPVIVAGGEVADVERNAGETRDLGGLALRQEPLGNATLVEDFDGACVQATGARAREVLALAPLDDGDIDAGQG